MPTAVVRLGKIQVQADALDLPAARWDSSLARWVLPADPASARAVVKALAGQKLQADREFRLLLQEAKQIETIRAVKAGECDLPPIPVSRPDAPPHYPHQKTCFWMVVNLWGGLPGKEAPERDAK